MGFLTKTRYKIKTALLGIVNKKPAFRIHRNGVDVKYFNLSDTKNLPFDRDTYNDTQVFIGKWSNPWYFDIDKIEDAYPNFEEENITKIEDVFSKKHVWPSQRWKLLANQDVLNQMFVGGALSSERIVRLLYLIAAGIGFVGILILFGGT